MLSAKFTLTGITTFADPSNKILPVALPLSSIFLAVVKVLAESAIVV